MDFTVIRFEFREFVLENMKCYIYGKLKIKHKAEMIHILGFSHVKERE